VVIFGGQCMLWTGGVGGVVSWEGGREGGGGGCDVKDMGEQSDDSRLDCAWVAEVGEAVG